MWIAKEGWPFIVIPLAASVVLFTLNFGVIGTVLGTLCLIFGLFCAFFFRDPSRSIVADPSAIVSPCDGTVMEITKENGQDVIRVFLSVFNVHLQRSPVEGKVVDVKYIPGQFLPAMKPEACMVNEQNVITISSDKGTFIVKQIAGILARRVVAWVKAGDIVKKGGKIGLIKFSSQVDLYVPSAVVIRVKVGDKVVGGKTVMGEIH
ncbi:MAG: phosphatidylserine decarboxylase [Endomicrobiales bacterium]|jgi:phosphatidylserine decarboxylase